MKFKDHADYMAQRDALLNDAETLLQDGNTEEYDAKVNEINTLDASYEEFSQKQADLAAMRGAVKAPISGGEVNRVVASVMEQDNDLEYRKQFMNYVMKGTPIKMMNSPETTVTSDVGAVIPTTILNKIVEKIEKVGNILNLVTRTYYKGGVVVPTSSAKPTAEWVAERGTTDTQKKALGSVTFAYNKLKVQVAVSLEVDNVTLEVFEQTLIRQVSEAIARALDAAIINGRGTTTYHEPLGILAETPASGQAIEVNESTALAYADLIAMEAALPEGYDDAIYVMNKKTFVSQVLGMVDTTKQPIARVDSGIDSKPAYTLFGRRVEFTSQLPAYTAGTVAADTIIAFLFRMEDYMLNTNMQPTISKYIDQDTDDEVTKCIMLADGKVVDKNSLVTLTVKNG